MRKYEQYEREKYKALNLLILNEEAMPDIRQTIQKILKDVQACIDSYNFQPVVSQQTFVKSEESDHGVVAETDSVVIVGNEPLECEEEPSDMMSESEYLKVQQEIVVKNKARLLKWVTDADFCRDFNLRDLADHPFEVESSEVSI